MGLLDVRIWTSLDHDTELRGGNASSKRSEREADARWSWDTGLPSDSSSLEDGSEET